jgi:hypothetical protein
MITVKEKKGNKIYYKCECGTNGMCTVKPLEKDAAIVIDIRCPVCEETERITLLQYSSDESKSSLIKDLDSVDLSWVPTFNEEILDEEGE